MFFEFEICTKDGTHESDYIDWDHTSMSKEELIEKVMQKAHDLSIEYKSSLVTVWKDGYIIAEVSYGEIYDAFDKGEKKEKENGN